MKNFAIAAVAALTALVATPAMAEDFTGPRVAAVAAYDIVEGNEGLAYGVNAGYDIGVGNYVVGLTGEFTSSTTDDGLVNTGRDLSAAVRVGRKVTDNALLFVSAGYTNARFKALGDKVDLDGVRVGAGLELALPGPFYATGEYRYSNYEAGVEAHRVQAGLGVRF